MTESKGTKETATTKQDSHIERLQKQIRDLDEKAQQMLERVKESSADVRDRIDKELKDLQERRQELKQRLEQASKDAGEDFKEVRKELEEAGEHMKNAMNAFLERFKRDGKK